MSKDKIVDEQAFNYVIDNYSETLKALAKRENVKYEKVDKILVVEPTAEELEAIRKGKEEFARREFFSYKNVEELRKNLDKD